MCTLCGDLINNTKNMYKINNTNSTKKKRKKKKKKKEKKKKKKKKGWSRVGAKYTISNVVLLPICVFKYKQFFMCILVSQGYHKVATKTH